MTGKTVPDARVLAGERIVLFGLVLLLATAAAYWNSFPGSFHYDDFPLMLEHPRVTSDSFDYSAFLAQYGGRPLTLWTFHVNYLLAGSDPTAFHAVNLGIHLLVVLLLFLGVRQITSRDWVALMTALLFGLHPFQTQAVNYIWSRSLLLMALFLLAALLSVRRRTWIGLLFFQLAIWSRAEAVVGLVPIILLRPRSWKAASILVAANLTGLIFFILWFEPREVAWTHPAALDFWLQSGAAFWHYMRLMLVPVGLSVFHSPTSVPFLTALVSWTGLLCCLGFVLRFRDGWNPAAVGMGWLLLWLTPSLLVPSSHHVMENRGYLAFAGFSLAAAWIFEAGFARLSPSWYRWRWAIMLLVGLAAVAGTIDRNKVWRSDVRIWEEAVAGNPRSFAAFYNLGVARAVSRDLEGARRSFEEALRLKPEDDMSYAGLAYCDELDSAWVEALRQYREALRLNPENRYASDGIARIEVLIQEEEGRQ